VATEGYPATVLVEHVSKGAVGNKDKVAADVEEPVRVGTHTEGNHKARVCYREVGGDHRKYGKQEIYIHATPCRYMEIGERVCTALQHNIGGELVRLEGGKCKVVKEDVEIEVDPDGAAKIIPKKEPELEITRRYITELKRVYEKLGLKR